MNNRHLVRSTALVVVLLTSGCSLTPWVKPYERANLTDPVMSFNRDPVSTSYLHHVYEVREGTRGAGIASGGG
ncbi:MAG: DUF4266 domain-containing protein, partial [Gammaproteobacteria bacterium]|nr:DUF4266 domain-containing protein [Gammaproteobacteria bacterium]